MSNEMPQDSVLRRHWQAARAMENQAPGAAAHGNSGDSNESSGSGFFGWLKSLFS